MCGVFYQLRSLSSVHVTTRGFDSHRVRACKPKTVKVSGLPRRVGASFSDAPPGFSRSSTRKSGSFQGSGKWCSVALYSEVAPSPGGFSRVRVSNGDGLREKVGKREFHEKLGDDCCPLPAHSIVKFYSSSGSDADPKQASRLMKATSELGHGSGHTRHPRQEQASAPDSLCQSRVLKPRKGGTFGTLKISPDSTIISEVRYSSIDQLSLTGIWQYYRISDSRKGLSMSPGDALLRTHCQPTRS